MWIILPEAMERRLVESLVRVGNREIGGILMGEDLGGGNFRVKELAIQMRGGTVAAFVRSLRNVIGPLSRFFRDTRHDYARFNYLGEWHSHPSFSVRPSARDVETMRAIVGDPAVGANFAVLLIVRLSEAQGLEASLTVFMPDGNYSAETLDHERNFPGTSEPGDPDMAIRSTRCASRPGAPRNTSLDLDQQGDSWRITEAGWR